MKGASWSRFVLFLCCLSVPIRVSAQDEIIIKGAHYPEGLFWDQRTSTLYYAEMPRDRIMRHVSGAPSVFFAHKGCGPTGIAPIGDQWAIACHIGRSLVIADQEGRFVRKLSPTERAAHYRTRTISSVTGRVSTCLIRALSTRRHQRAEPFTTGGLGTIWHAS